MKNPVVRIARLLSLPARATAGAAIFAVVLGAPAGAAEGGPLTLKEVFARSGVASARLSPDGKHIAAIIYSGNQGLVLIDAETMEAKTIVVGKRVRDGFWHYNKEPIAASWVTNDLLAVDYGMEAESVNLEGKKIARIGEAVIRKAERDRPDSPMLLVYSDVKKREVSLVNARTGDSNELAFPMVGRPIRSVFDKRGVLRAMTLINSEFWKDVSLVSNWYRASAGAEWEKLAEFKVSDDYWVPYTVPDEAHTLVVVSRSGRDTYAVFSYDTAKRQIGEMMAGHPTEDILAVTGIDDPMIEGVVTSGMKPQIVWFDPAWAALQKSVDKVLPNRINQLSGNPASRILIHSYSDIDPGTWYVLNTASMTLVQFGRTQYAIDPARMRPMETVAYQSADGLRIPAYLTRPAAASGPAPTVVLIHGGPTVRDEWEWNEEVQVLAAHGFVVFQPQFRGSSGFGRKFQEAGYGQWGLAMQDDVTAGVGYLVAKGIADPNRICIYGASYGGYAALWGLVKTPDLYRCGVSFAGVSDLEYMMHDWSDTSFDKVSRELMRAQIGDAASNKEKFEQVSPLKHAGEIRAPVLLMHGEDDLRVPISHGYKMKSALEDQQKPVEWKIFWKEGHGLSLPDNEYAFYELLLGFLDKYIGASEAKPASPAGQ